MKKIKSVIIIVLALVIGMWLGSLFFGGNGDHKGHSNEVGTQSKEEVWTCSMHPQIRQTEPGKCPLCGMDLILLADDSQEGGDPNELRMSAAAMKLANVQTTVVSKKGTTKTIRLNGKVQADERYVFSQTSHIAGRIEKLFVTYTGEHIQKGQEIAYIYSPELVTAQDELLEAIKIKDVQPVLYKAAIDKLKKWKLTDGQVESIIKSGKTIENFPILSNMSGVVLTKRVNYGDHVMQGESLFEVADLSKVWVLFDVYESDMAWVANGDEVEFSVQSLPGEKFKGKISFIDPVINPMTRVAKARISISNNKNKLKPEMFVIGLHKSVLEGKGNLISVPKSAVMWTGERSVVYVKTPSDMGFSFMAREVVLGPSLGDSYVIRKGLEEGEEVVTNGTFSIDAAAQLAGKASMMNRSQRYSSKDIKKEIESEFKPRGDVNRDEKKAIYGVIKKYLVLKNLLTKDSEEFQKSTEEIIQQIKSTDMSIFKGDGHMVWMKESQALSTSLKKIKSSKGIKSARKEFANSSIIIITLAKHFGPFLDDIFLQYCSMAGKNGSFWISKEKKILNPYFGDDMLGCGDVVNEIK